MFCVSLKGNYHKYLLRTNKKLISISMIVIGFCLLASTFNIICRTTEIPNIKIRYQDPFYYHHKETYAGESQFIHVLRSLKKYELIQLHERHRKPLSAKNVDISNYSSSVSDWHYDNVAHKSELQHQELDKIQSINRKPIRRLPQAIIIGVKKCGTRAILEYLRLHPDIRAPGPEPHFFDRYYHLGLDWYRQKMPPTIEGQITIEKTPRYFVTPEVPARISNVSKYIKLIVVVRDPVIRAISDFTQGSSKDPNLTETFAEKAFHQNGTGSVHKNWSAIKTGIYIKHIKYWLNYFSITQMHFVSGENLISNPAQEVQDVTDFLNLKRVISNKHFYFNETKGFPCLKKHEKGSETKCFDRSKGRPHPYVDKNLIQKLKLFFKPYNEEFYSLVGKDFGWS